MLAAVHVVTAMGRAPRPDALGRMLVMTAGYAVATGLINAALGTNYAFQCQKPPQASLFDHLGPIPWHNGSAMLLGLVIYSLLHLPFVRRRKA